MKRALRLLGVAGLVLLTAAGPAIPSVAASRHTAASSTVVTVSKTVGRVNLDDGVDDTVDSRNVSVSVSTTEDLRDRQPIQVTWRGAHASGGLVADKNSGDASLQEYPVVVMQCRGVDSASAPAAQRIRPQTCWTQTPQERFQYSSSGSAFPSYRMDRYATTAHRALTVDQPNPLPAGCTPYTAAHWVPFVAADGTRYNGGIDTGCEDLAPEAADSTDSLQPASTTYGAADTDGYGTAKFVVQTSDSNASLGCSNTVKCSLVVIPIEGISCDPAGTASGRDLGMAPGTRPSPSAPYFKTVRADCEAQGRFDAGELNPSPKSAPPNLAVTGALWWSESNWRNRMSIPLSFSPPGNLCSVIGNSTALYAYGSESLSQATQQWGPYLCRNPKLFTLKHVQTSEPQAKNLLDTGSIEAAIQAAPPAVAFAKPTVQAPAAISGLAIAYSVDGADGQPYGHLKLDARLIAKLLSESYRSCPTCLDFSSKAARDSGFYRMQNNPLDLSRDPEFRALNPDIRPTNYVQAAATLEFMSSDADLMTALTSYLDADPEAREFLNGYPDPWGMVVNPAYRGIALPVSNWPLLDTNIAQLPAGSNQCLQTNPVPWLPLVASPVSNPATVALHMQFDISNSQVGCKVDTATNSQKLVALGRQTPGIRFVLGLVSLADAARYQLNTAELQTVRTSTGDGQFDDAKGRMFTAPTTAALNAAAALLRPVDDMGTWPVPYDALRKAKAAYPGTTLVSFDVPTTGLPRTDARQYAQLLRFVVDRGQRQGTGAGDLPPGYLPLGGRTAALAAYTSAAADAIADQKGTVPFVSGKPGSGLPTKGAGETPTRAPGGFPSSSSSGTGSPTPAADTPAAPASQAPSVNTPASTPSSSSSAAAAAAAQPRTAPVGKTSVLGAGALGLVLPLLVLLAAAALGVAAWTSGVGRR